MASTSKKKESGTRLMSGAEIVVESLVRNKIDTLFAYPGGYTMPLHQVLTRYRDKIRVILPRHEQGGGFAAQGYARSTGKIGVCMTTSGPGATNMITSIADAKLDSIPLLAISGQVATNVIGSDGFQETPITEVCRSITKHHYLVTKIEDIARIIDEAIFVAMTGRPGPVLVDIPKDLQTTQCYPEFGVPMNLPGYSGKTPKPKPEEIDLLIEALHRAKRPVFFVGGGMVSSNACAEFLKAVEKTGVPVITSMTGLSAFPRDHHLALGMGGMHGGVYANKAIHESDLLIGLGVRFSDRVTGKVSEFAKGARLFQIDIDASEINKIKKTNYGLVADLLETMILLNKKLKDYQKPDLSGWYEKIEGWKKQYPLSYDHESPYILPEAAIEELSNATQDRKTIIATGVGQHQLWTTQFYHFSKPRTWLSSCGLGTMGFGLPAAMGAKIANPDALVVDIDGDGSLQMNIQEMATCHTEKIPVKIMLINNQHLGNVMQWEDRFYGSNRANTYLGMIDDPEAFGKGDGISPKVRYPDYAMIARGYGWDVISISRKKDLAAAIQEMINSPNPFLLDLATPYKEHVLPMTPPGGTIDNVILK